MEFNTKFDNDDYIITISSNSEVLSIVIEEEKESRYWKKDLDKKTISDITSQMGSYKSLEVFTKMLLAALKNDNENITLNFCSLNEIQQLSENKKGNSFSMSAEAENNIKKYLMLVYTQFEKVVYPIQLEYLDKTPDCNLLKRTINRLRNEVEKYKTGSMSSLTPSTDYAINYNEFEKIKKENQNLISKLKLLESQRPLGAVENDDIYKNYAELAEEFQQYKEKSENKIKMLLKSIDDLKETQFRESKLSYHEKDKNKSKIIDLEQKLQIASDTVTNERKQGKMYIDEKNKQIEALKKEIKTLKDNEKNLKVKISKLEKELESANRKSNYYRYGNSTPKSSKSYKTNSSGHSSYASGFSSSKKSSVSYVKKNLVPNNPYDKYKGLTGKNYKPFSFMKNKTSSYSLRGNSKPKSSTRSKGSLSIKSGSSVGSKKSYNSKGSRGSKNSASKIKTKPFSKPKVSYNSGGIGKKTAATKPVKSINTAVTNSKVQPLNKGESINISDRLGRLQNLINQASK